MKAIASSSKTKSQIKLHQNHTFDAQALLDSADVARRVVTKGDLRLAGARLALAQCESAGPRLVFKWSIYCTLKASSLLN